VLNAVALWFELQLDEQDLLTTSPDGKGGTWQNAVYFVDELRVSPGDQLRIEASHDTYSIAVTVRAHLHCCQCAHRAHATAPGASCTGHS
jgi:hypothetical protein